MPLSLWPFKHAVDPITEATRRLEQNPRDVLALVDRAESFFARHDAVAALRDIERALQIALLEPRLKGEPRSVLLSQLYTMKSRALVPLGQLAQAEESCERALAERPANVDALVQRGRIRRDSGNYPGALQDLDRALDLDPDAETAYLARGMVRQAIGDAQGALADYNRAIELNPKHPAAWSNRGRLHLSMGKLAEAERDCRTAIRLDPRLINAYANLAAIARQRNDPDSALRILADGLGYNPGEPDLLVEQSRTYINQDRLAEALTALNTALQQAPDHAEALSVRGQLHGRRGDIPAALADLGRATELNPGDVESHFNHALAQWHAGNRGATLAALGRVLQLDPKDQEARTWRTRVAAEMGLGPLDRVAALLEHFAYSHCGPGIGWKVELRQMHRFEPGGRAESYNAAVLDLQQIPETILQVTVDAEADTAKLAYTVKILQVRSVPGSPRPCLFETFTQSIPARLETLLQLLNHLIAQGTLTPMGRQLRYS